MASITIRNLDDDVKTRLRVRAADSGRSMEEEVRLILRDVVGRKPNPRNLADIIRSHFGPANGVDLELPPREPGRDPVLISGSRSGPRPRPRRSRSGTRGASFRTRARSTGRPDLRASPGRMLGRRRPGFREDDATSP